MDPPRASSDSSAPRLPRRRGDERSLKPSVGWKPQVTLRARGWTVPRSRVRRSTSGFPAHAGMDPSRWPASRRSSRLPRTRGDAPRPIGHSANLAWSAPCTFLNDFARLNLVELGRPPGATKRPLCLEHLGGLVPRRSATDGCPVGSLRRRAPVQGPAGIVGAPVRLGKTGGR